MEIGRLNEHIWRNDSIHYLWIMENQLIYLTARIQPSYHSVVIITYKTPLYPEYNYISTSMNPFIKKLASKKRFTSLDDTI